MQHSSKLPFVGTTIFSVMSALAAKHNAINLSQGFPDFKSDPKLIDLVSRAMQSGHNQYAPCVAIWNSEMLFQKNMNWFMVKATILKPKLL